MTDLKDKLNLKRRYRNKRGGTTIGNDFIRPCLKEFKTWRRCTLNFTKSALKSWAGSFTHIVKDDVQIEILCDIGMVKSDNVLMKALESCVTKEDKARVLLRHSEQNVLLKAFGADASIDNQEGFTNRYGWDLLHYMIAKEKLIIKFAANTTSDEYSNLYHEKAGYFTFPDGSIVSHYGTFNESESAHRGNNDSVRVWPSWDPSAAEDHQITIEDVDEDFAGNESVAVYELSKETLEEIKKTAPTNLPNRNNYKKEEQEQEQQNEKEEEKITLYKHQESAINAWFKNNGRGIVAHATGTGKTFTSIWLLKQLIEDKSISIIVGVPYVFLADQWASNLNEIFKNNKTHKFNGVIECYDSSRIWKQKVSKEIFDYRNSKRDSKKHLSIYVTVNKTFSDSSFQEYFSGSRSRIDLQQTLFIGDECHKYTSQKNYDSLLDTKYRLGLSATPFIKDDNKTDGEQKMNDYFGGIIDEYPILDGLRDGVLCQYEYHPQLCNMNSDEFNKWLSVIRNLKIDEKIQTDGYFDEESDEFKEISKIISDCEEKFNKFDNLLNKLGELDKTVIFCGERKLKKNGEREVEHIGKVLSERGALGIVSAKITAEVNREQRNFLISEFKKNNIKTLNAIRVLDEGIDIPTIEKAIILASSANRRQFVQRRGRVLRQVKGENKLAKIYDFVILPNPYQGEEGKTLIYKELERMEEMSEGAKNEKEIYNLIQDLKTGFENAQNKI